MKHVVACLLLLLTLAACTDGERMRRELAGLQARNQADSLMTNDSLALILTDYFDRHGTPNEQMLAHYLLGRTYADMGEAPAALDVYFDALECADTVNADCDYEVLRGIYGQMSQIFHRQNLPHDEIWALQHYIDCIKQSGDTLEYLISKSQMIRPYYILGEKDTVLEIIHDTYQELHGLGYRQQAADIISVAIYIYTERGELEKARNALNIFENESKVFDEYGNIEKGRESYYSTKGFYYQSASQLDSAEIFYRKAIHHGYQYEGYKGLMAVYRHKSMPDSIVLYSYLFETAQDSLHNQMRTDAIHQAASLYNYSRSQKLAEQEARKASRARMWIAIISLSAMAVVACGIFLYYKNQKKKRLQIQKLAKTLADAQSEYQNIQEELQKLREKDYEGLQAEKEQKEQELLKTISRLKSIEQFANTTDNLQEFQNSQIVRLFHKKAMFATERPIPNDAEWRMLEMQFDRNLPATYSFFHEGKRLSPLELRTCILLLADFPESDIINLTQTAIPSVSTAKARANQKLFDSSGATTLKYHLQQRVRHL
mgnify:CR=1 FL=1